MSPVPGFLGGGGYSAGAPLDDESNAFLDIQAIFFAIFHPTHGPRVLFQMPEGSISQDDSQPLPARSQPHHYLPPLSLEPITARDFATASSSSSSSPSSKKPAQQQQLPGAKRIPTTSRRSQHPAHHSQPTAPEPLFDFAPIQDYIIPKKHLCGRLVACTIRGKSATAKPTPNNHHNRHRSSKTNDRSSFSSSNRSASKVRSSSVSRYTTSDIEEDEVQATSNRLRSIDLDSHEDTEEESSSQPAAAPRSRSRPRQKQQDPNSLKRPARNYKVLGYPVFLSDEVRYARNDFRFNMCFVFDASADVRPYEPVVRKIARILTGLEESSSFLSNERNLPRVYGIIEQLYQDLNSYCESFVALPVAPHTSYVPPPLPHPVEASLATPSRGGTFLDLSLMTTAGTPTAGVAAHTGTSSLFHAAANAPTSSVLRHPSSNATSANASPYLPSSNSGGASGAQPTNLSPSPSRISNIRGRRRGRTIDILKREGSASSPNATINAGAGAAVAEGADGAALTGSPLLTAAQRRTASLTALEAQRNKLHRSDSNHLHSSMSQELTPEQLEDAQLHEWESELPHGLGRTVRDAINVKLFPIYPNPPSANDWDVPVALLDLKKRVDANWDLTMAKIFPFIDGVNHVKRIAELADADLALTRQCMEHLLYYECIIMIDLFQYSNVYILRPLIASAATNESIQRECADYVIKPGKPRLPYSTLLSLYAKALRPGITVSQWMEDLDVDSMHLDVRRFVTFGVIKGFVRRVHRFPIYTPPRAGGRPFPLPMTMYPHGTQVHHNNEFSPLMPGLNPASLDGTRCDDELCVSLGLSWHQLERMLLTLGYAQHELAQEMAVNREREERIRIMAREKERATAEEAFRFGGGAAGASTVGSYAGGSGGPWSPLAWNPGSGGGGGGQATWINNTNRHQANSSNSSHHYGAYQGATTGAAGSGAGGGGGGGTYTSPWGTGFSPSSIDRRSSGAPTITPFTAHRSGTSSIGGVPPTRGRYPSDAGWGSASSFGAHMSGIFQPLGERGGGSARGSISEASPSWTVPARADSTGSTLGAAAAAAAAAAVSVNGNAGGGANEAYDRNTGERLPANARPRSPSPVPGPDWSVIYSAARTCGHMGDVQIFLR
ncbi:Nitrogen permease regulator 2 [Tilletia horrida]|nr:Nitrogen permease regulator 2 [Tilletia horrida]